jgi:hypothetical protein
MIAMAGETIIGGWAEVYRKDRQHSTRVEVSFEEYAARKKDGSLNSQWSKKPATMIRKVAVVQALREAFPTNLGGMYSAEEVGKEEPEDAGIPAAPIRPETGEVIERNWGANKPKIEGRNFVRILPESAQGEIIYRNAIAELEIMEAYTGNPKHGKNTKHDSIVRQNATSIKEALQNAYEKNPSAVQNAIMHTNPDQDFHSVQYMYRAGAYGAYITRFGFILDQLDMNVDYESEEDYDEGNFEY